MPSVTADTNIYNSGLLFGGLPERFLMLAAQNAFRLDISDAILGEIMRVLREKFEWSARLLQETENDMRDYTNHVTPAETLQVIQNDVSDNRILECALRAKSDFIVSGDSRHVLSLGSYAGIPIVSLATFMNSLVQN